MFEIFQKLQMIYFTLRCIVVASKADAHCGKIPIAFLNRFEKQVIDRRQCMREDMLKLEGHLDMRMHEEFYSNSLGLEDVKRWIPGWGESTLPSLLSYLQDDEELQEKCLEQIMENACAECFTSNEFNPADNLSQSIEKHASEAREATSNLYLLIRTHDRQCSPAQLVTILSASYTHQKL